MTRARVRRRVDVGRIREAVRGPNIDTNTWVTAARVEEEQSVYWDPALGWLVDTAPYGSSLEGEKSLTVRLSSPLGGDGAGEYLPPPVGAEVLLVLPAGDPDKGPVAIGYLTNEEDAAPTEIHGLPIQGDESDDSQVSPHDTEIKVSPHTRREQYAGDHVLRAAGKSEQKFDGTRVVQAKSHVLAGDDASDAVKLGSANAADKFVKGAALVDQISNLVDQLMTLLSTGANSGGPVSFAGLATFQGAWAQIKATLQSVQVLSDRVKGE